MAEINIKGVPANDSSKPTGVKAEQEEGLDDEFVYVRSITIKAIEKESAYRQLNIGVLGRRVSSIGSSINSTNILCSNAGEVEAYFPMLIGISPNNPDFHFKVREYLSNIQVTVTDKVTFDNSLRFRKKRDYLAFKAEEERINNVYENSDKRDVRNLKKAIDAKVEALNKLESDVYKTATPVKLTDYLMYRHCMLYSSVAKDKSLANSNKNIRFYLVDEVREKNRQSKIMRERKTAMTNFIAICGDPKKFDAVFVRYCTDNHLPLYDYMAKDINEKELLIDSFAKDEPQKFNEMCADSNLMMISFIERLIARGELVRSEYNQQINTSDGSFIGKNMKDAVAYFNNPDNKAVLDAFEAKLKLTSY